MEYSEYINGITRINDRLADARWLRGELVDQCLTDHAADGVTAGDIAAMSGVAAPRISEDLRNWRYYGNLRTSEDVSGLPYDMYTRARQKYKDDVEFAMATLARAKREKWSVADLRKHLEGIEAEGVIEHHELPERFQGMVESPVLWVTFEKYEDEGDDLPPGA
jgi:hypothetical protein